MLQGGWDSCPDSLDGRVLDLGEETHHVLLWGFLDLDCAVLLLGLCDVRWRRCLWNPREAGSFDWMLRLRRGCLLLSCILGDVGFLQRIQRVRIWGRQVSIETTDLHLLHAGLRLSCCWWLAEQDNGPRELTGIQYHLKYDGKICTNNN